LNTRNPVGKLQLAALPTFWPALRCWCHDSTHSHPDAAIQSV